MKLNTAVRAHPLTGGSSFDDFQSTRHFTQLDGLRAVSVLLVLATHMTDPLWRPLHGYLGVTIFFVISGFLITTLMLREEKSTGRVSIRRFYLRRAFRIFPLYYLALLIYSILVLGVGLGTNPQTYMGRLPHFLTYTNEFASAGTFGHSWSLGIEEKFYLIWPLLAFALVKARRLRLPLAGAFLAVTVVSGLAFPASYLGIYVPIVAGCVLALLMHRRRTFELILKLSRPLVASVILTTVALTFAVDSGPSYVHVLPALAVTLVLPVFILGRGWMSTIAAWRPLRFVGSRSYAFYLMHPLCKEVVSHVLHEGQHGLAGTLARFVVTAALSLAFSDLLYRTVEQPMIRLGRRVASRVKTTSDAPHARREPALSRSV